MTADTNEHFDRVARVHRHLLRNIDAATMPPTLAVIERALGLTERPESPDAGRPWEKEGKP